MALLVKCVNWTKSVAVSNRKRFKKPNPSPERARGAARFPVTGSWKATQTGKMTPKGTEGNQQTAHPKKQESCTEMGELSSLCHQLAWCWEEKAVGAAGGCSTLRVPWSGEHWFGGCLRKPVQPYAGTTPAVAVMPLIQLLLAMQRLSLRNTAWFLLSRARNHLKSCAPGFIHFP